MDEKDRALYELQLELFTRLGDEIEGLTNATASLQRAHDVIGKVLKITARAVKRPAVADVSSLPLVLTLSEMAALYRISIATIRRGLQNGTFAPRPCATYPYRWSREDVLADLRRPRAEQPHRPHGFAARKRPPSS